MYEQDINILSSKKEFVIQKKYLLKGSSKTNFLYKIDGIGANIVNEFNGIKSFKEKFELLKKKKAKIEFIEISNEVYKVNLILVESCLGLILSYIVLNYYQLQRPKISEFAKILSDINPINFDSPYKQEYYEHKLKEFLVHSAFGMNPKDVWRGSFNAYVFVKKNIDGSLNFYPLYEIRKLEDYLFNNTMLETPSKCRNRFGDIYEENGEYFIKLNLQIRFC